MKLINPSYTILEQQSGSLADVCKQIELAGRTCYKSEDKITEDSAEAFVQRMIDSKHTAMLEHGTVYLYLKRPGDGTVNPDDPFDIDFDTIFCKYGKHNTNYDTHEVFFTTNLRWLVEKYPENWKDIFNYYSRTPDERWPKRHTVKLTTSLHVYKDLTRHRTMSFAIESTRYCNYSKDKFGNELTFIKPCWYVDENNSISTKPTPEAILDGTLSTIEKRYMELISLGWKAQQAAEVLPQCVKADVVITGFEDDWNHIFDLRALGTTGAPHPEVERIITPIMEEFYERKWTNRHGNK